MKALTLASALAAAMAMAACDRANEEDRNAAASGDPTVVAQAEQAGQNMEQRTENGMERAREAGSEVAQQARETGSDMADKAGAGLDKARETGSEMADRAGEAVADTAITASVNAELARDDKLSALRIDVDTSNGKVSLNGTAPSEADRERATQLASSVKGVTGVENNLTVKP